MESKTPLLSHKDVKQGSALRCLMEEIFNLRGADTENALAIDRLIEKCRSLELALQRRDALLRRWLEVGRIRETGEALIAETESELKG